MRLKIPRDQLNLLVAQLSKAGNRESGGQIFGEQLAPSNFVVSELTFQQRPGTIARFIVDLVQAARDAVKFFDTTGHRYSRHNYIGEWHSHPSYEVRPSEIDLETMRKLVRETDFRGNFAVLMIARLDFDGLKCGAWVFDASGREFAVDLELPS